MLANDGTVRILDLGIALLRDRVETAGAQTQLGATLGTPDYIAPEQAMNTSQVDIRADIYSLGCTFYRLITGKVPFHDSKYQSDVAKLLAHTSESPPSIHELAPDTPINVVQIIDRMMERYADDRYQTPNEIVQDLAQITSTCDLSQLPSTRPQTPAECVPTVNIDTTTQDTKNDSKPNVRTIADESPAAKGPTPKFLLPLAICCGLLFVGVTAVGGFLIWNTLGFGTAERKVANDKEPGKIDFAISLEDGEEDLTGSVNVSTLVKALAGKGMDEDLQSIAEKIQDRPESLEAETNSIGVDRNELAVIAEGIREKLSPQLNSRQNGKPRSASPSKPNPQTDKTQELESLAKRKLGVDKRDLQSWKKELERQSRALQSKQPDSEAAKKEIRNRLREFMSENGLR